MARERRAVRAAHDVAAATPAEPLAPELSEFRREATAALERLEADLAGGELVCTSFDDEQLETKRERRQVMQIAQQFGLIGIAMLGAAAAVAGAGALVMKLIRKGRAEELLPRALRAATKPEEHHG